MYNVDEISKIKINNIRNEAMMANFDKKKKEKKRKKKSVFDFVKSKFVEFCERTDFHGYKYIVMKELTMVERMFWGFAVLISVGVAVFFVISAYAWYSRNPIITVIESTHNPIWDVPFPSVTICNMNVISRKAARSFADKVLLPPGISSDEIFAAARVIPILYNAFPLDSEQTQQVYIMKEVMTLNNFSVSRLVKWMSPVETCNSLVQRCMWKNTIYRCELLFKEITMQYGICCSFNYYAIPEVSISNELYHPSSPRKVASCGYQTALSVLVQIQPEDYYSSLLASFGALVIVDNAYNYPDGNSPAHGINPLNEVFIAISPESTYATSGIRAFAYDKRECFFEDEIKIDAFSTYTYHNCILHRKVRIVIKNCGCVPVHYPTKGDNRVCGFEDIECVLKLHNSTELYDELNITSNEMRCLPDCTHYDYPLDVAVGFLAKDIDLSGLAFFKDVEMRNQSIVNVFFNDLVSTRYRRDVYLNWQNLLASFGGLLSLMLGFTLISAFDLIIFICVRIIYDPLKRNRKTFDQTNSRSNAKYAFHNENRVEKNNWMTQNRQKDVFAKNKF